MFPCDHNMIVSNHKDPNIPVYTPLVAPQGPQFIEVESIVDHIIAIFSQNQRYFFDGWGERGLVEGV